MTDHCLCRCAAQSGLLQMAQRCFHLQSNNLQLPFWNLKHLPDAKHLAWVSLCVGPDLASLPLEAVFAALLAAALAAAFAAAFLLAAARLLREFLGNFSSPALPSETTSPNEEEAAPAPAGARPGFLSDLAAAAPASNATGVKKCFCMNLVSLRIAISSSLMGQRLLTAYLKACLRIW